MKIKGSFILKKLAGDHIVVPVGSSTVDLNAVITLNETGAFLWEKLDTDTTEEALADALCKEFDVAGDTALSDVRDFTDMMRKAGVLEE